MNRPKPTRADKRHLEELLEAVNDAYLDGKPVTAALDLLVLRRWQVVAPYQLKMHQLKTRIAEMEALLPPGTNP